MPSISEINQAIVAAFPSEDALHRAVFFAIDKNLYEVAGQKALPYMVFELVAWSEARGVAQDAGLRVIRLNFGGSAEDIWSEIVEEARKQQRLSLLVQIALDAYPNNPIFRNYQ